MNVAIIPARGGSKRIKNKNIKTFCGKPIIAYSIEVALASKMFDEVIVSTDDPKIADIAREYGAQVPFMRPAHLADDYTGTNEVIEDTLFKLQKMGKQIDFACCIYATAPFLQKQSIVEAFKQLQQQPNKAAAFTACKFNYPIQRSFTIEGEEKLVTPVDPESIPKRSQDLASVYHDAGQLYLGKASDFINQQFDIFSDKAIAILLPSYLVQDIDDEQDWLRAELMYQALTQSGQI